ncbi:MAG: multidrug MFS transporter [Burkholderiales bacterium RIFCSPHIGHO2_12_FULL_69_20]|nr:MAG: multidrug MFS transporter [Burkholderiales bacterium RIFCSPHIGHO2_12_FULL_69_20]
MPDQPAATTSSPAAEGFSRSDRRALAAVLMAVSLVTLDSTITSTALPRIAAALNAQPATSIWVVNAYQLAVAAALLPFAALGDRLGARRIHLGGMVFFVLASLGSALADSLPTLAAARALQGIGSAAMMSVNVALIRQIYPAAQLGRGVGLNALVVGVSFAAGPTVASLLMAVVPWPWLYVLNLPLGALAFGMAWSALPRHAPRGLPFDPVAALLTAVTFAAAIAALGAATQREPVGWVLAAGGLALGCGALLLRRQTGHPAPMLPVDLLRRPLFALSVATALASFAAQGLAFVSLPFFFETVLHRSPVQTGFLMAPWAIVVAAAAPLAGRLSERYPPGLMGGIGLVMLSAGLASLALLTPESSGTAIVLRMALCGAGFGLFQSPNLNALMSAAPPERSGSASGMVAMARLNGQALGAALVALCFGLAGAQGPTWALALGAGFAALAALASSARLLVR